MKDLDAFAAHLYGLWNDIAFTHTYHTPPKGMWRKHLNGELWSCTGLKSAKDRFVWSSSTEDFDNLSASICDSIKTRDQIRTRDLCNEILIWGGVGKSIDDPSRMWIDSTFKKGELTERLTKATSKLYSPEDSLADFDGISFPMNSGMTKIYAACDPNKQVLIYDGRVGAALCLLVKRFLKSSNLQDVPTELLFRWGRSRDGYVAGSKDKRDPSDSAFRFPQLFTAHRKDWHHASCSRRFNILAESFCSIAARNGEDVTGAELERSLFMVGYDVRGGPQS